MPALFEKSEAAEITCRFDIRVRVLISLLVSGTGLILKQPGPLALLAALTFLYVLSTRRYKLIALAYLLIAVLSLLSLGIVWGFFQGLESALTAAESEHARMAAVLKISMIKNFHIPFLRLIPSLNVLLAIALDFEVQSFIAAMKSIRLPRLIFLPLTVFCRFIPEFIQNLRQLRDAVLLRGFSLSPLMIIIHPWLTLRLTFVPMVIRALRMGDNLAMAAEMKRIGYAERPTVWKPLRMRRADILLLLFFILAVAAAITWQLNIPEPPSGRGMRP